MVWEICVRCKSASACSVQEKYASYKRRGLCQRQTVSRASKPHNCPSPYSSGNMSIRCSESSRDSIPRVLIARASPGRRANEDRRPRWFALGFFSKPAQADPFIAPRASHSRSGFARHPMWRPSEVAVVVCCMGPSGIGAGLLHSFRLGQSSGPEQLHSFEISGDSFGHVLDRFQELA